MARKLFSCCPPHRARAGSAAGSRHGGGTVWCSDHRTGGIALTSEIVRFFGGCVDVREGSSPTQSAFSAVLHVVHVLEVPLVAVAAVERLAAQLTGQVEVALTLPAVTNETGLVHEGLSAVLADVVTGTRHAATVEATRRKGVWKENQV